MVECLNCLQVRTRPDRPCPRCGYVGWAWSSELDEQAREGLREHPPARRRLRLVS